FRPLQDRRGQRLLARARGDCAMKVSAIKFDERGLVPVVVQDAQTGEVLTLAYMNAESLARTLRERETWFWSRSRAALWHKGATSGHTQRVVDVRVDCDADALLVRVEPRGPACHTGARTCFHQELEDMSTLKREATIEPQSIEGATPDATGTGEIDLGTRLQELYALVERRRVERPAGSYTTYLFDAGRDGATRVDGNDRGACARGGRDHSALLSARLRGRAQG